MGDVVPVLAVLCVEVPGVGCVGAELEVFVTLSTKVLLTFVASANALVTLARVFLSLFIVNELALLAGDLYFFLNWPPENL